MGFVHLLLGLRRVYGNVTEFISVLRAARGILACLKLLMQTLAAEGDNIQVCSISDGDGEDLT